MSILSQFNVLKRRVITILTVPPVHEDPYVNAILNTKITWREAFATLYLLFGEPFLLVAEKFGSYMTTPSWKIRGRRYW